MVLNGISQSSCKVYSLTWSEYSSSLIATAQNLRNVEDLTDVTISAGGKIFPAHKLVLSAASPLLMELLKNTKCQHPILMLAGISAFDLETILDFVYRGEINIDSEKLPSLLQAAQFLDIRALSPTALVLNSLTEPSPVSDTTNQTVTKNDINASLSKTLGVTNAVETREKSESQFVSQKRKKVSPKPEDAVPLKKADTSAFGVCKQSLVPYAEDKGPLPCASASGPNSKSSAPQAQYADTENHEATSIADEKKIVSDLPVNCKLCGVTIRQSRNLRRHVDQRHSKPRTRQKQKVTKDGTLSNDKTNVPSKANLTKKNELNNNSNTHTLLNFSDDSFTRLTEEILSYSTTIDLTSNETSFSSSSVAIGAGSCLINDKIPASAHDSSSSSSTLSTSSSSSTSLVHPQALPTLLESDLCFPLSTTTTRTTSSTSSTTTAEQTKSMSTDSCSSIGTFECSNLEDTCNMNDIALKELENQLFSVCFCSAENEV